MNPLLHHRLPLPRRVSAQRLLLLRHHWWRPLQARCCLARLGPRLRAAVAAAQSAPCAVGPAAVQHMLSLQLNIRPCAEHPTQQAEQQGPELQSGRANTDREVTMEPCLCSPSRHVGLCTCMICARAKPTTTSLFSKSMWPKKRPNQPASSWRGVSASFLQATTAEARRKTHSRQGWERTYWVIPPHMASMNERERHTHTHKPKGADSCAGCKRGHWRDVWHM